MSCVPCQALGPDAAAVGERQGCTWWSAPRQESDECRSLLAARDGPQECARGFLLVLAAATPALAVLRSILGVDSSFNVWPNQRANGIRRKA